MSKSNDVMFHIRRRRCFIANKLRAYHVSVLRLEKQKQKIVIWKNEDADRKILT